MRRVCSYVTRDEAVADEAAQAAWSVAWRKIGTVIMDGAGAYEGLTAVLLVENHTPHGFIIDGAMPPVPENASTK